MSKPVKERGLAAPFRVGHLPAQPQGPHLQQRQSTQLHVSHLQQAQAFFSVSTAVMAFSCWTAELPWIED